MIQHARSILGLAIAAAVAVGCTAAAGPTGAPGSAATVSPSPAAGVPIPSDFPLGSWTSTITEAQLRAAGITEAGLLQENAGPFTQTFNADGTWAGVLSRELVKFPVFRGTFRVTGDHQFEQTTTFPPEYAGDVVAFTWQLDKGALIMRVPNPPDPMLKVITEANPWQPK